MVYNETSYKNGWFRGYPHFRKTPLCLAMLVTESESTSWPNLQVFAVWHPDEPGSGDAAGANKLCSQVSSCGSLEQRSKPLLVEDDGRSVCICVLILWTPPYLGFGTLPKSSQVRNIGELNLCTEEWMWTARHKVACGNDGAGDLLDFCNVDFGKPCQDWINMVYFMECAKFDDCGRKF